MGKVSADTFPTPRDLLSAALFTPEYSLRDGLAFFRGIQISVSKLLESIMAYDARQLGTTFETPLFFFQGALDLYTPTKLVQEYAATLRAPHREVVVWEREGHLTFLSNPNMVLTELLARVRPWVRGDTSR